MKFTDMIKELKIKYEIISEKSFQDISDIVISDRECGKEIIFTSIKGFKTDGHNFIGNAYMKGCRNFIIQNDQFIDEEMKKHSTVIKVDDPRTALSEISCIINDHPHKRLKMIGITGTKGKTTVSALIYEFLRTSFKSSLFTTVKNIVAGIEEYAERTTMESNQVQSLLKKSADNHDDFAVVEVSSHGVTLKRINGIQWDIGVFTSFSQDHLDLYGTMEKYFEAKLEFFKILNGSDKKNKKAFINIDDPKGCDICSVIDSSVKIIKIGQSVEADFRICNYKNDGLYSDLNVRFNDNDYRIRTKMKGFFNMINIAIAAAVSLECGINFERIREALLDYKGVEGRFEIIVQSPFTVIVDYAHSPDSLQKMLEEALKIKTKRLITVFGCAGERDREKRPIMGEIASRLSDYTFITNDDTYGEDPMSIAISVEKGFIKNNKKIKIDYEILLDRKEAIIKAVNSAAENDIIVIAGMGHQRYQHLAGGAVNHNDREFVLKIINNNK